MRRAWPGYCLRMLDHRDAVRAGLRRQVEVHDLGEHLAQDRHEHFVERRRQHRRFVVRRPAHVAAVVDRVAAHAQPRDGASPGSRPGRCSSRCGRRTGPRCAVSPGAMKPSSRISLPAGASSPVSALCQTRVRSPRSRPANSYSDSVSGTGATAASMVAGSAPIATSSGNGLSGCAACEVGEVQRAAAVRQPAHDHAVARHQLLPVDGHVLARLPGAAGHHQAEGDQLAPRRPASSAGSAARPGRRRRPRAPRVEGGLVHGPLGATCASCASSGQLASACAQVRRPSRLLDRGQQFAQFAQRSQRPAAQRQPRCGRGGRTGCRAARAANPRVGHQQRGTAALQRQPAQRGAFQVRVHRCVHLLQLAAARQRCQEAAQVVVAHPAPPGGFMRSRSRNRIRCRSNRPRAWAGQIR